MATFSKLGVFSSGYFRSAASWLLRNRKSVAARVSALNAEIERIGKVTVTYVKDAENNPTYSRQGFAVTKGSTLARLCQAYIAGGGNPLDISSFMYPDSSEVVEDDGDGNLKMLYDYPDGGLLSPRSADSYTKPANVDGISNGNSYTGGFSNNPGYNPGRQGARMSRGSFDSDGVVRFMASIRGWANQDIKQRLQDAEWRIIKQCDLREQLVQERDNILTQAFAGCLTGAGENLNDRIKDDVRVQCLIQDMSDMIFSTVDTAAQDYNWTENDTMPFLGNVHKEVASEIGRDPLG